jgi:hypothetical protein
MKRIIEVGSKLRKTGAPSIFVEVTEMLPSNDLPPHVRARVRCGNENLGTRLYAIAALQNSDLFVPVGNDSQ